jgi:hypothetical protein
VNCWVVPFGIEALVGLIEREVSVGAVTVNAAEPLIVPEVAVTVLLPCAPPVARPVLLIVATEAIEEVHVAVKVCVVLLLYVPVAVNCWVSPAAIEAVAGVTEIEVNTAAVTVSVAEPLIFPEVAVIVAVPVATLVPKPLLLTVATEVFDEVHVALVKFWVVPLLYVPVAVNCSV